MLFVLTGCMGGYTFSKCANRATDLAGLEGRYTVADLGASVDVVRTGTGTYNMVSEGQVMTGLTTCVVNGNELAEANSENINVALLRKDATLTVTTFDTAVLDAAGIKYETAVIEELGGVSIVAVDGEMADDVFTSALVLGDVSLLKQ
jgi:hypothetical protein